MSTISRHLFCWCRLDDTDGADMDVARQSFSWKRANDVVGFKLRVEVVFHNWCMV